MPTAARIPLIAIGFNTYGTGLTRVMHRLLRPLASRYDIHYLGLGYQGTYVDDGIKWYPTNLQGGDVFAQYQACDLIDTLHPRIVFVLHDVWLFEQYMARFTPYLDRVKLVAYIPIDGSLSDETLVAPLLKAHQVVVYTPWAQREFEHAFQRLRATGRADCQPPVSVVPHAVDVSTFYPDPELLAADFAPHGRQAAKHRVFPGLAAPASSFIVLNASRPAARKRVDLTIEGFAQFAEQKPPNVYLCLHHAFTEAGIWQEIQAQVARLGIAERLLFNPLNPAGGPLPDARLNQLYQACDVGLNTSMGEAWGLVSFEHAAAGAAQIVPRHSACQGLWEGHALLLEPEQRFIPDFSLLQLTSVSAASVADALERLYQDRALLQRMSSAAYSRARQSAVFSWEDAAAQFDRLFTALLG